MLTVSALGIFIGQVHGYPPRIERADMDGKNQRVILELASSSYPSGMTIDYSQSRLYWADRNAQEVNYLDLETNPTWNIYFWWACRTAGIDYTRQ